MKVLRFESGVNPGNMEVILVKRWWCVELKVCIFTIKYYLEWKSLIKRIIGELKIKFKFMDKIYL